MKKKNCKVLLMGMALSMACSFTSLAGWEQAEDGSWKFYTKDGSLATNAWKISGDKWYYFDSNGNMAVNTLIEDQGNTYHVNADGIMSANQWVNYNDVYYYAGENGAVLKSTVTPDGYTVDASGAWDQSIPQQAVVAKEQQTVEIQIPAPQGYGTVNGNVTWQYNKFIGTKADTGADVYLIPLDFSIKGGDNKKLSLLSDTKGKNNVFYVKVDGMGQYVLNNIPTGNYRIFIKSKNTTSYLRFDDEATWNKLLDGYFESILTPEELESFKTMVGADSFYTDTITVQDGKATTISHDFGYTYI